MRGTRARRWLPRGLALMGFVALTLACTEVGLRLLASRGRLPLLAPAGSRSDFWDGDHPEFGVWHRPHASTRHEKACFSVDYRANSVGARDAERALESDAFRVIVLGDSVVEGWGLSEEERFSNLLERATGFEHLNFGMSHFGPYQQVLVYRNLAKRYAHAGVIFTVYPINDLADLEFERARANPSSEYRYRPYLVRDDGSFRHLDYREPRWQRLLRRHTYAYNAARSLPYWLANATGGAIGARPRPAPRVRSYFYGFSEQQLALLTRVVELMGQEARGVKLAVVLVPALRDLGTYGDRGPDPLSRRLAPVVEAAGGQLVNLLPLLYAAASDRKAYYFPCDSHWNAHGNRVAFQQLLEVLGDGFYPRR